MKNSICKILEKISWLAPLVARVSVGWVFLLSGWGKLHNLGQVSAFFTQLGIPFPTFNASMVAATETLGGALLIIGLFSRLAALPLAITMIVAIATAKLGDVSSAADLFGLSEFLFIVIFLWIIVAGPGCVSLDAYWCKRCRRKTK